MYSKATAHSNNLTWSLSYTDGDFPLESSSCVVPLIFADKIEDIEITKVFTLITGSL